MQGGFPASVSYRHGLLALLIVFIGLAVASSGCVGGEAGACPHDGEACLQPKRVEGKYGYVDAAGEFVIPPRFDGADTFSEGLALVLDSGRFGYIDTRGALAIPAVYRHARAFRDGLAPVRLDGSWQFIDRDGNPLAGPGEVSD